MVQKDIPLDLGWIKIRCTSCPIVIHKVDRSTDLEIDCYMVMLNIFGKAEDIVVIQYSVCPIVIHKVQIQIHKTS